MTLAEAQKKASQTIEAAIGADHPRARGTYTYRMLQQYKAAFTSIDTELKSLYAQYLSGVSPSDYYREIAKLKPGVGARISRLEAFKKQIAEIYNSYARKANRIIANASIYSITQKYYMDQYAVNWFGGNYFVRIPQDVVNVSVFGTEAAWRDIKNKAKYTNMPRPTGTFTSTLLDNNRLALRRINNAITQGLINGTSYATVSKNLLTAFNSTASNALRIVRTESHRNAQAGAYLNSIEAAGRGIPITRQWLATLDGSTRDTHGELDGEKEDANGMWHSSGGSTAYPGGFGIASEDIQCRCETLNIIDGVEPEARAGRNPVTGEMEIMDFKDYGQWARDNGVRIP